MCGKIKSKQYTRVWANPQKSPYAYNGNQWISYDDAQSLTIKTRYARSRNLGGVFVQSIDMDDFSGHCGHGHSPLLVAVNKVWYEL